MATARAPTLGLGLALALGPVAGGIADVARAEDPAAAPTASQARAAVARAAERVTAGQPVAAVEALREAMLAVWSAAPFGLTQVLATTESANGFRAYTPREPGPYTPGEPLHLYIEPIGLTYVFEDGAYDMGMKADFLLMDTKGTVLGGQRDFADVPFRVHAPSTDVFLTISLGTQGLPPDDYILQVTVRDALGDGAETAEFPFTVAAP
jgi:hypothetical protein